MADKLGLGSEVRQLKLGSTFTNPRSTAFHSIRCKSNESLNAIRFTISFSVSDDFKPASVDLNKKATIDVGSNNQVTVSVPHLG